MSQIIAGFRHSALTHEPEQLTSREIWAVAHQVRNQLLDNTLDRQIDLSQIEEKAARFEVNGIRYGVLWDFEHDVRNARDDEVMGVTEYHDTTPMHVLVSINGPRLRSLDTLLRSTVAHELGHVVFDAPGWLVVRGDAFVQVASAFNPGPLAQRDLKEVRANEFMGALLVPAPLIRVDWLRLVKRNRLPLSVKPSQVIIGAPAVDGTAIHAEAAMEILYALGELYGVSSDFIRVRLARYDLLRTPRPLTFH
jgi:Zn-dependent peptidase ImmA (M78 family)